MSDAPSQVRRAPESPVFRCFMLDGCEQTVPHVHVPYTYNDAKRAGIIGGDQGPEAIVVGRSNVAAADRILADSFDRVWETLDRLAGGLQTLLGLHETATERIAALEEDAASLRDFVHGLNDRVGTHELLAGFLTTGPHCKVCGWGRGEHNPDCPEGATAPRAEVSDRD